MQEISWLPLTEYALRSGTSISTLRRKIKTNSIEYKMVEGRYLIRGDDLSSELRPTTPFISTDISSPLAGGEERFSTSEKEEDAAVLSELALLRAQSAEQALKLRALDARISGLVKKIDYFSEQNAELKMLVKLFEEKLDSLSHK